MSCAHARIEWEARESTTKGNFSRDDKKNTPFLMLTGRENGRRAKTRWIGMLIERTIRKPCLPWLFAEISSGVREHNKRKLFSRGWEEDLVHHDNGQRKQEARKSMTYGYAPQKDDNKTLFAVIACRENIRRCWSQQRVIILVLSGFIPSLWRPHPLQFSQTDTQWFQTHTIRFLQLGKKIGFISVCLSVWKIDLWSYLATRLG